MEPSAQLKAVPIGYNPFRSPGDGSQPVRGPVSIPCAVPPAAKTAGVDGDSPGGWRHAGSFLWMAWRRLSTAAGGRAREAVGNTCTSIPA